MPVEDIYTEIIAESSRSAKNRRTLPHPTAQQRGVNPSCGDDITLQLDAEGNTIQDIAYTGEGCAISQASASLMADLLRGRSVAEARELAALFLAMVKGETLSAEDEARLEDCVALQGVAKMPARVKCAGLAWHTLEEMLGEEVGKAVEK